MPRHEPSMPMWTVREAAEPHGDRLGICPTSAGWMPSPTFLSRARMVALLGDDIEAVIAFNDVGHVEVIGDDHLGANPKRADEISTISPYIFRESTTHDNRAAVPRHPHALTDGECYSEIGCTPRCALSHPAGRSPSPVDGVCRRRGLRSK